MPEMIELVWQDLKKEINGLQRQSDQNRRVERAEISDNIPAYTLATAPDNTDGGLGTGSAYVTVAWISDGRKSGEGAGAGTGVLAVFQSTTNQWLRLTDYSVVVV
jgi:hypothetical protein